MIGHWWQALVIGLVGGAIPQVLVIIAALRADRPLRGRELAAMGLESCLGAGVLLFAWHGEAYLQVAVQGAAFPSLFAGLVRAATEEESVQKTNNYLERFPSSKRRKDLDVSGDVLSGEKVVWGSDGLTPPEASRSKRVQGASPPRRVRSPGDAVATSAPSPSKPERKRLLDLFAWRV